MRLFPVLYCYGIIYTIIADVDKEAIVLKSILIVTEVRSYYLISIKQKLEHMDYTIYTVPADTDAINEIKEPLNAILIYADDNLVGETKALNFLKDKAIADDTPVFMMATPGEARVIYSLFPKDIIANAFLQPINVNDSVSAIDSFINHHNLHVKNKILVVDDSGPMLRTIKGWLSGKYNPYIPFGNENPANAGNYIGAGRYYPGSRKKRSFE